MSIAAKATISLIAVLTRLALLTLAAPVPTIDNPCGLDPNAALGPMPIGNLLRDAITQANAANATCQVFLDKMKNDNILMPDMFAYLTDKNTQLPGLPIRQVETNVSRANAFNSKLRQVQLNITILHTANEMLANTSILPREFDDSVNSIDRAMLAVNCMLTTIAEKVQQNFTQAESRVDTELQLLDYTSFGHAETELYSSTFSGIEDIDTRTAFLSEGVIAQQMKEGMRTLVAILRSELASLGSL